MIFETVRWLDLYCDYDLRGDGTYIIGVIFKLDGFLEKMFTPWEFW